MWHEPSQEDKKFALGCAALIMTILLCTFVFGPHPGTPDTPQAANAASTVTQAPIPTIQPTATPIPQQLVQPTPTPVPPTQVPVVQPTPTTPPVVSQTPTQPPVPQPTPTPAIIYNTDPTGGQLVYNPPADFCTLPRRCVSTFWTDTRGYVVECGNGEYSHSGGINGACSQDGKVVAKLYQHG